MTLPIATQTVRDVLEHMHIASAGTATIRQTMALCDTLEQHTGQHFVHLEMGSPGLPACSIGIEAQKSALDRGVAQAYPNVAGIQPLKQQASRFVKAFLHIDINPEGCVPTTGSMMGTFASFLLCTHLHPGQDTILFLNPGFSVQPLQVALMGYRREAFDIYHYRGAQLHQQLDELLSTGRIAAIVYSNPNNPSWVCLTEEELRTIGHLATRYDTVVIEDLAYLGMDFRKDLGHPFEPPYQATVARYTPNYLLMISASKIFSYAGERVAVVAISDALFHRSYKRLEEELGMDTLGNAFIYMVVYCLSSGVAHSAQYALAAMFQAACDGRLDFVAQTRTYAQRAARLKEIFLRHGFHIVYDKDLEENVGDGFFFTIGRKGFTGDDLVGELIRYGIATISLRTAGSTQEGVRVCTSSVEEDDYLVLDERLKLFNELHTNH